MYNNFSIISIVLGFNLTENLLFKSFLFSFLTHMREVILIKNNFFSFVKTLHEI